MKPGVVIVNTSRGALIGTEALIDGLKRRRIGAAYLDVYEEESDLFYEDRSDSIVEDDVLVRLIAMPNVIITSHQAVFDPRGVKQHCSGHGGESSEIQARRSRAGSGGLLPLRTVGLPRYAETALALPARSL